MQLLESLLATKNEKLDESEAANIIYSLTNAVLHCHERGIVHRDIKLDNLLVIKEADMPFIIKLSDFGLSKKLEKG